VVALIMVAMMPILARSVSAQESTPGPSFPTTARFVNAMTSVGTIDVDLNSDDNRVVQGLKYGEVSDPIELTAPVSNIIVKEPRNNQYDLWLFNTIVSTTAGQSYVITVSDFLLIPVSIDLTALPLDLARGRLVNASSQAPSLDIVINGKTPPLVTGLGYGQATDTGNIPAGTYDISLNQSGTANVALDSPNVAVSAGQAYVWVLIGKPGSTEQPLTLLTISAPSNPD